MTTQATPTEAIAAAVWTISIREGRGATTKDIARAVAAYRRERQPPSRRFVEEETLRQQAEEPRP